MSVLSHPLWPTLRPYIRIERYAPDGGHRHPRIRIEVLSMPPSVERTMTKATMPCVACGASIHFVRTRRPSKRGSAVGHHYFAPTCPLEDNVACSRGAEAHAEYERIRAVMS